MRTLLFLFLVSASTAFAGEVSREEASKIIDEMVKSNMISASEASKAKLRLKTMNATEWTNLNKDAEEKAAEYTSRAPASVPTPDLEAEQYSAIENDLKKIAPAVVNEEKVEAVQVEEAYVPEAQVEHAQVEHVVIPETKVENTVVEEVKISEIFVPQT